MPGKKLKIKYKSDYSSENYKEFERWQRHDDAQDNFCVKESSPGEYVDLLLNPERYTGYKGVSAHRIWRSIYMENCFRYITTVISNVIYVYFVVPILFESI